VLNRPAALLYVSLGRVRYGMDLLLGYESVGGCKMVSLLKALSKFLGILLPWFAMVNRRRVRTCYVKDIK